MILNFCSYIDVFGDLFLQTPNSPKQEKPALDFPTKIPCFKETSRIDKNTFVSIAGRVYFVENLAYGRHTGYEEVIDVIDITTGEEDRQYYTGEAVVGSLVSTKSIVYDLETFKPRILKASSVLGWDPVSTHLLISKLEELSKLL